ncbi:MAG: hypothetical protein FWH40_10055 [Coriobacteriia bacterium]|nr:hypothetical protein [Coriobacteriia bacterium]
MTVSDEGVIDFAGIDKKTGRLELTLIDHLAWGEVYDDAHLLLLQSKLNAYLQFIESGQVDEHFTPDKYEGVVIRIIAKYPFSADCLTLLNFGRRVIKDAGFDLEWETEPMDDGDKN